MPVVAEEEKSAVVSQPSGGGRQGSVGGNRGRTRSFLESINRNCQDHFPDVEFLRKAGTNEFSANHSTQDILNEVLQIYQSPHTLQDISILKQIFKVLLYVTSKLDNQRRDARYVNKALLFLSALFLQHNLPHQHSSLFKLLLLSSIILHVHVKRYHALCKEIVETCLFLLYHEMKDRLADE